MKHFETFTCIKYKGVFVDIESADFKAGKNDCTSGIFDKWYRYNRNDDGMAYEAGWALQNDTSMNETVTFIGGC